MLQFDVRTTHQSMSDSGRGFNSALVNVCALRVVSRHRSAKPLLILTRREERAYHTAIVCDQRAVDDTKPEVVASVIRVAPEITKVLHQHLGSIVFAIDKRSAVDRFSLCERSTLIQVGSSPVSADERIALRG